MDDKELRLACLSMVIEGNNLTDALAQATQIYNFVVDATVVPVEAVAQPASE
jgi:hypothetical protein